jgi:hypothetical protein
MVGNLLNHDDFVLKRKIVLVLYRNKIFFSLSVYLLHEKSHNMSENMPRMTTEERRRALGMLHTGCCIREG